MPEDAPQPFVPGVAGPDGPAAVRWFVFRGRELLITAQGTLPDKDLLDRQALNPERSVYLGRQGPVHCYAAQLAGTATAPTGTVFANLMALPEALGTEDAALAGRAVQIVEWDRTHQHCGACGAPTQASEVERSRTCPDCQLPQFPRLSPAVIVAVERGDQILLGRAPHFPRGIYSVLAGFVEPGESAEETVVREVWEETQIRVEDVRYFGSQSWPFPHSLMLGFRARYQGGEIQVDGREIETADWFRPDAMPRTFAGNVSISQWLIRDFLDRHR